MTEKAPWYIRLDDAFLRASDRTLAMLHYFARLSKVWVLRIVLTFNIACLYFGALRFGPPEWTFWSTAILSVLSQAMIEFMYTRLSLRLRNTTTELRRREIGVVVGRVGFFTVYNGLCAVMAMYLLNLSGFLVAVSFQAYVYLVFGLESEDPPKVWDWGRSKLAPSHG